MPKSTFDFNSSIKEYFYYKTMEHIKSSYDLYKYISNCRMVIVINYLDTTSPNNTCFGALVLRLVQSK